MSISAIRLLNFRGFQDATIELKPLTVLLGPNSSGKSSFGHALAAMAHCHWRFRGGQQATLTPGPGNDSEHWPIDLGGITDLRRHGQTGRVDVELRTEAGTIRLGFGEGDSSDLRLSFISHPVGPSTSTAVKSSVDRPMETRPEAQSGVIPIDEGKIAKPPGPIVLIRTGSVWWDDIEKMQSSVDLDGLVVRSAQHLGRTSLVFDDKARNALKSLLESLVYLRATRKRPSRGYENRVGQPQAIGYAGEWTPTILHEKASHQVFLCSPPNIPDNLANAKSCLNAFWEQRPATLLDAVGSWLRHLRLATSLKCVRAFEDNRRLQVRVGLPGQQDHDITEIGFGVSQILPVLISGLLQPENSLMIVDLPEAHLHPAPQARLADFFCSLALSGRFALIETHSEMFFHQLRLRAEMSDDLARNIAVYFLDQPKDGMCSQPRPIGLRYEEEIKWPVGFMEEAWSTETSIRIVRQARGTTLK